MPPGRPRSFDRTTALAKAMEVFWTRGYEGTSLTDLTEAMGINRPSIYAAFGNKEALFAEALALYEEIEGSVISRLLDEAQTAREAMEATMRHNARVYADEGRPRGCMIVLSALLSTIESEEVRHILAARRRAGEEQLRIRIERGKSEGDVPAGTASEHLASFVTTVLQGMSVKARDGASHEELSSIVDTTLACWPARGPSLQG